jgi:hypothetical protein
MPQRLVPVVTSMVYSKARPQTAPPVTLRTMHTREALVRNAEPVTHPQVGLPPPLTTTQFRSL